MEAAEVEAMVVSGLVNIRYLTGFQGRTRWSCSGRTPPPS